MTPTRRNFLKAAGIAAAAATIRVPVWAAPERKKKMPRKWRIYYGDDSTFSDRQGKPWDAPAVNVQVAAYEQAGSPNPKIRRGDDAYVWRNDIGWVGVDIDGQKDYLMTYRGPKAVLFGRTITDDKFQEIVKRATKEGVGRGPNR